MRRRALVVLGIGLGAAIYAYAAIDVAIHLRQELDDQDPAVATAHAHAQDISRRTGIAASDFGQVWFGARTLLAGGNPYEAIGPGRAFEWDYPLFYPVTALVAIAPLTWLPLRVAEALFAGVGAGLLAWGITRRELRNPQLLVFLSGAMIAAMQLAQWSAFLTAAALMPSLGFLFACKPTLGLAFLVAFPSRRALILAASFALVTVAIWPWWVPSWVATLSELKHTAPVMRPGGLLLLLAALKWRRPDARLLTALACVPQTFSLYDAVPLFLIVTTFEEGLVLVGLMFLAGQLSAAAAGGPDYDWWMMVTSLWLVYMPCLVMTLRRPNVAEPPAFTPPSAEPSIRAAAA